MLMVLAAVALALAAVPALLFRLNSRAYQAPPEVPSDGRRPRVSVLIPARNEERSIQDTVAAALASEGVELELLVLDDHSDDATSPIVRAITERDSRVKLFAAPELPDGWCGKQHACWVLAHNASHDLLLFLDADVRLAPGGLARLVAFLESSHADLVSGIPRQETNTWLERLVIPLIHFILLGFLPLWRMRTRWDPAYGAGCGQLFLARRSSYQRAGGHATIRGTLHDGIKLPRAFRAVGLTTDLCDATDLARCRMYHNASELWRGLAKNASEGLGSASLILPSTLLLFAGQVLPIMLAVASLWQTSAAAVPAVAATACSYYPRLIGASRFRQPIFAALFHPLAILVFLAIQWYALVRHALGMPSGWKGRSYTQQDRF